MVALTKRAKTTVQPSSNEPVDIHWIDSDEAAERLGIRPKTLVNWRSKQLADQPRFYKPPGKTGKVRYKLNEVDAWLESHGKEF